MSKNHICSYPLCNCSSGSLERCTNPASVPDLNAAAAEVADARKSYRLAEDAAADACRIKSQAGALLQELEKAFRELCSTATGFGL